MAALQWRSTTQMRSGGRALPGARPARMQTRVQAIINPHKVLGVSETADVKDVKRAYRKLALQYHPDVCKSEEGHHTFITLTQAYELLLGKAEGKDDPNHAAGNNWDFHDWYWSFRMSRSWEQQKGRGPASAASGSRAAPQQERGYQQDAGRDNLRSQLAGLRHRAAVRANRPPASPSSSYSGSMSDFEEEEEQEHYARRASSWADHPEGHDEAHAAAEQLLEDEEDDLCEVAGDDMAVCDGHYATVLNHAVPLSDALKDAMHARRAAAAAPQAGAGAPEVDAEAGYGVPDAPDSAPDVDAFSHEQEQQQQQRRRGFVGGSNSRESVSSQLAGLRRKAHIKATGVPA